MNYLPIDSDHFSRDGRPNAAWKIRDLGSESNADRPDRQKGLVPVVRQNQHHPHAPHEPVEVAQELEDWIVTVRLGICR